FNEEADFQVHKAQPKHDEALASSKWSALHSESVAHFPPVQRSIGPKPWQQSDDSEVKALGVFNLYCFRCHGTVQFSVFDKIKVLSLSADINDRIGVDADIEERMPPDRVLPDADKKILHDFLIRRKGN